jgi:hypothetical protein
MNWLGRQFLGEAMRTDRQVFAKRYCSKSVFASFTKYLREGS